MYIVIVFTFPFDVYTCKIIKYRFINSTVYTLVDRLKKSFHYPHAPFQLFLLGDIAGRKLSSKFIDH